MKMKNVKQLSQLVISPESCFPHGSYMINGEFCPNFPILTKWSKIDPVLIFIALLTTTLVTIFIIPDNSKKLYEGLKRKLLICDTWLLTKSVPNPPQTHRHTRIWWWIFVFCCILHSVSPILNQFDVFPLQMPGTGQLPPEQRRTRIIGLSPQSPVFSP